MATASADLGKLAAFVAAADGILNEGDSGSLGLNRRIGQLRESYDAFQASGSSPVRNFDLMGGGSGDGDLGRLATSYRNDRLFVEAVRRAFQAASGSRQGSVTVDAAAFDRAFATAVADVSREHGLVPADLLARREPVTVNGPWAAGIPQSSGFVNDPVCTATGHFVEVEEDFSWPERLESLRWRRVYSSRFVAEGPFGRGWASWAGVACLAQRDGTVGFQGPDGQLVVFSPEATGVGYGRVSGVAATLSALPGGNGAGGPNGRDASTGWELVWDWHSDHPGEVWRFDAAGRLRMVSGPTTGTTEFSHAAGRLMGIEHDSGRRLDIEWAGDRIVEVRSSCGRAARYHYNHVGDLVRTERVLGDRRYVVDDRGLIIEVRDADDVRLCRNTFDDEGRVVAQVSPYGRETVLRYHPGNRTVVLDTADGPVAVYEHDQTGRLTGLLDHDGHRMERTFDADGRCIAATGFDGATSRQVFEGDGRAASRIGPDRVEERWEYDDQHRLTSHQVDGGPGLGFAYDGDSVFPSRVAGPDGWEMRLEVVDGLLRRLSDADGVSFGFEYDADGNVIEVTNALGAVTRMVPHVSGAVARMTLADGAVFDLDRDPAGRLLAVRTPTGDVFRIEWSPAGRLIALVEPNGARTVFEQGSHGDVERIVDALGAAIELHRDHLARLVGVGAPGGTKWGFDYTAVGLLSMVTDPTGATWSYDYDAEGRLVAATDPSGHQAQQRYNPAGRLVEFVDRCGNATRYNHDALGRIVRQEGPEGAVTAFEWDTWGRPTAVRFPDGDTLSYSYTPAGRVAGVRTADGRGWTNTYDPAGRLVAVTDAVGAVTAFEWDVCDRPVAAVSPSGRVDRYRYDPCGRAVEVERAGRMWRTEYDYAGRVVASTDPTGATTRYAYDLRGKLAAATDPLGHTVRIRYDERGNATGVVDPFGGLVTATYDAMRRPVATADQLGRVTRVDRDATGRAVRKELPTGEVVEWRRDPRGRTTDVRVAGRDVVVFDRDRCGRPVLIHEPARNRTFTLSWTAGGRLRSLDVDGRSLEWERDRDGYVTGRRDPTGRTTRYTRDRAGWLSSVTVEGWGEIELARDPDGQLVALQAPGIERRWDYDAGGLVVATHITGTDGEHTTELVRDAVGRVVEMRTRSGVTRYRYDSAGQLVAAARGSEAWVWHYDPAGRLAREEGPHGIRSFSYDDAHQLVHIDSREGRTTFAYDAAGRRTAESGPAGTRRYHWNGLGRLAGIDTDHHTDHRHREVDVDALGQLAAVDATPLTWDPTTAVSQLVAIGDRQVIGAAGHVLGLVDDGGATAWLPGDGRGLTDRDDGRDPWGRAPDDVVGEGPELGYLGEVDIDGLVWLRNRVYDPETRQFLSPDPLPGVPGLPVAANPYHYANNNPIGFVDPLGLQGQPMSIADYNQYRSQEYGWQWNNIVTVGLVAVGVATMFIPGLNVAGMVLIGAALGAAGGAAPGVIQGIRTGEWDWGAIGTGALKGAIIGGASAGVGGGLGAASTRLGGGATTLLTGGGRLAATARGGAMGAGSGALGELYDLTPLPGSDGQFDPESVAINAAIGAGSAGGLYRPPTTPTGPPVNHQTTTPTDLHAFGGKTTGPRPPRPGDDYLVGPNGQVVPQEPPLPRGASTFGDPQQAPLSGHYHRLPAGTDLPEGFAVAADGSDVIPTLPDGTPNPNQPTHHSVYPTREMSPDEFQEGFRNLFRTSDPDDSWNYAGKKR